MGLVHFLDPVDYISGKISKKFITIYNHRLQSDRRYTQVRGPRLTRPSADEISHRTDFGAIARATNTRLHNQAQYAQDMIAFKAQTRYKTLRKYVWNLCTNEYYNSLG